jgi:maleate isomerase
MTAIRIGLVVPSSNTTMETEVPELLLTRGRRWPPNGSPRTPAGSRCARVTPEELAAMNAASDRCADELADARCDVPGLRLSRRRHGRGPRARHVAAEQRLEKAAAAAGHELPVVTSAGALVHGLASAARAPGGA